MATAFTGYILPWGQMSFWGATVITSLITAIPGLGEPIAYLVWGGYNICNATLNRFFSFHFLLPIIVGVGVLIHLSFLHAFGSKSSILVQVYDTTDFYPYYYWKDGTAMTMIIGVITIFFTFTPNYLGHPDNFIHANSLVTPTHIVPEWYFLPFYAILRAIPNKIGGVIVMGAAIISLYGCSQHWVDDSKHSFVFTVTFILFILNFLLLGYLGGQVAEGGYLLLSRICTIYYFVYIEFILPVIHRMSEENISFIEVFTEFMPLELDEQTKQFIKETEGYESQSKIHNTSDSRGN